MTSTFNPMTNRQLPDNAILDRFNKQAYLGNRFIFSVPGDEIGATSETPILLLTNPAVSKTSFPSGWAALFCDLRRIGCLTAAESAVLRFYLTPTFSAAGTAKVPQNIRPGSPNVSIAALSQGPTVSNNGVLVGTICAGALITAQADEILILDPGQSLLITAQTASSSTFVAIDLGWYEL